MARPSILSDELLRQLVPVGQVDIMVGLPTHNHAATIGPIVTALHAGLAKHFPRERTVLVNPDAGSDDGTREILMNAPLAPDELRGIPALRTTHRVSAGNAPQHGHTGGVRAVFAAADLLQAKVVVLVDPDVIDLHEDWVEQVARPVLTRQADLLLPCHPRRRFDGALLSQLVRPLLGAAFARQLPSHVSGEFGCSGQFAAQRVTDPLWEQEPSRASMDIWLLSTALALDLRITEANVGPRKFAERRDSPGLSALFGEIVGTTFGCLDRFAANWLSRTPEVRLLPGGPAWPLMDDQNPVDPVPMAERFRSGVRDLAPLLHELLTPGTHAALRETASAAEPTPRLSDSLWATIVYEFAAAVHRHLMNREHAIQALVPIYLGRAASHFAEIASSDEAEHQGRLNSLESEFARLRPVLLNRWNA
ncbi:MAG: hypothetical protein IT348_10700 [Candidatus Eisenbacteria bacterium]|nr:hypothetical protein [Candidatus Eisenbacteria bacterium]